MENKSKDRWYRPLGISGRDSFVFVVPKDYVKEMGMKHGDYFKMTRSGKRLILEPAD